MELMTNYEDLNQSNYAEGKDDLMVFANNEFK